MIICLLLFEPFRSEPPTPNVTIGNVNLPTTQGSYCWRGLLLGQCKDMAYTSLFEMGNTHNPTVVSPNERINIEFKRKPIAGTLKVAQWVDDDTSQNVKMKNSSISVPKEKGVYVYHLVANWERGRGTYAFSVEVK